MKWLKKFLVICLILFIAPLAANAWLIRIDFDVDNYSQNQVGLGYMEFDDNGVVIDRWMKISDLENLNWEIGFASNLENMSSSGGIAPGLNMGEWYGDIKFVMGADRIQVEFDVYEIYKYNGYGSLTVFNSGWFDGFTSIMGYVKSEYDTTVWTSAVIPTPIPSSLFLLSSAMLFICRFKRIWHWN